ncbi:helix-turn-helix transcriptional regulator [Bradyrhizobium sp. RDT46]|uniref:helix-turn-helix transcriptional regulator n=1 Tax=Bradyrhizobium sp. RDT46 TaxID=3341829 RepID=UPI0035C74CA2
MAQRIQNLGIPETGQLLRLARSLAGFSSAKAAAIHFGWSEPSMRAHESGTRKIGPEDAKKYAAAFGMTAEAFSGGNAARTEIERLRIGQPFQENASTEIRPAAVGARLKLARKVRGYASAYEFSVASGIVQSSYGAHEVGNSPVNERMAEAYAEALSVSARWLTRGELPTGLGEEADKMIAGTASLASLDVAYLARIATPATVFDREKINLLVAAAKARKPAATSEEDEVHEVEAASIVRSPASPRRLRTWKLPKGLVTNLFGAAASDTVILVVEKPMQGLEQGDRLFVDTSRRDATAGGEFVFYGAGGRCAARRTLGRSA